MRDDDDDDFARKHAKRNDPHTSHEAAEKAEPQAHIDKGKVFAALKKHGPMNSERIAEITGIDFQQTMKRVSDLKNDGLVIDSGEWVKNKSRRKAIVWALKTQDPDPPGTQLKLEV